MPEPFKPIRPLLAPAAGGEAFSIDAFLPELADLRPGDVVAIIGGPRSGKSTTLRTLRPLIPSATTLFLDDATYKDVSRECQRNPVIYTSSEPVRLKHRVALRLVPWGQDQWIEYLLANHRDQCASVMARLADARACARLAGNPELWTTALAEMARNEHAPDHLAALRSIMERRSRLRTALRKNHPLCAAISTAARIIKKTVAGNLSALPPRINRDLLLELVSNTSNPDFAAALDLAAADPERPTHTVPITVLHLSGIRRRPHVNAHVRVPRACLPGLDWSGVSLTHLEARDANLRGAALPLAVIGHADLRKASLEFANLRHATFRTSSFCGAHLNDADLTDSIMHQADFREADLSDANAEHADFSFSVFNRATLSDARLVRADLSHTELDQALLANTDLSAANLAGARISHADLRTVSLHGARLAGAHFFRSRLDALAAEALDFHNAFFTECDLSLTTFRNALLENAKLHSCGLADADWEAANLRNADLRGSTFHAGSSRSGLVFSPIASEGTRTGFYTDEYDERTHRAPEEIRKANLCFADLRGASVTHVDFYLVDLRRARYDDDQAAWFKRCGAILFDKR